MRRFMLKVPPSASLNFSSPFMGWAAHVAAKAAFNSISFAVLINILFLRDCDKILSRPLARLGRRALSRLALEAPPSAAGWLLDQGRGASELVGVCAVADGHLGHHVAEVAVAHVGANVAEEDGP